VLRCSVSALRAEVPAEQLEALLARGGALQELLGVVCCAGHRALATSSCLARRVIAPA
jgi:hypothetical protein